MNYKKKLGQLNALPRAELDTRLSRNTNHPSRFRNHHEGVAATRTGVKEAVTDKPGRAARGIRGERRVLQAALFRRYLHDQTAQAAGGLKAKDKPAQLGNGQTAASTGQKTARPIEIDFAPTPPPGIVRLDLAPHGTVLWQDEVEGQKFAIRVYNPGSSVNGGDFDIAINGEPQQQTYATYQLACNAVEKMATKENAPAWVAKYSHLAAADRPDIDPDNAEHYATVKTLLGDTRGPIAIKAYIFILGVRNFGIHVNGGMREGRIYHTYAEAIRAARERTGSSNAPDWMAAYNDLPAEDRPDTDPDTALHGTRVKTLSNGTSIEVFMPQSIRWFDVKASDGSMPHMNIKSYREALTLARQERNAPGMGMGVRDGLDAGDTEW